MKIIEFSLENGLNKIDLGMDFVNDYYMKKERFIFNQRRLVPSDIIDTKRDLRKKQSDELMKKSILENEYYLCNEKDGVITVTPKHSIKNIEFKFGLRSGYVFGKTIFRGVIRVLFFYFLESFRKRILWI